MSNPVIKIALPTKSTNSINPRDYSLHSDYSSIKIFKKNSGSQVISGSSTADVSITHSVGFYPMCLLYVELTPGSNKWYAKPFDVNTEDTYVSSAYDKTYSNTSDLKFRIINNTGSSKTIDYYYFILGHSGK